MRTGSHVHALFKGTRSEESFWFALSDSLPVITGSANDAAKQILAACRRGDAELVIGTPYRIATPGWASRSLTPSLLTFRSDREARRSNELSS